MLLPRRVFAHAGKSRATKLVLAAVVNVTRSPFAVTGLHLLAG